jgi:peptide alpha-N-acetyltransferase
MAALDKSIAHGADPSPVTELPGKLDYIQYEHSLEAQYLPAIRALISKDLSEPYSIYVYRYFLYQWGHLCFMVCLAARCAILSNVS